MRELQKATLTNCIIRVVYQCRQSNEPHILEATYNPEQNYVTKVYTKDGEEIKVDVERSGLYPLRLFGWSEIETLGREASRQRELLDRLIPGLFEKIEQRNELRTKLAEKRREIESALSNLLDIMNKNQGEIRRYREYKARFEKLNTEEIKTLFAEFDIAKSKEDPLEELKVNVQSWLSELKETIEIDILADIKPFTEESKVLESWWIEKKKEMRIVNIQADIRNGISKGKDILKSLICELDMNIQKVKEEIQDKSKEIRDKVSEEATKQVAADLRRDASELFQKAEELRQEYENL